MSGLGGRPGDVVYNEDCSSFSAAEALTIVQQNDKGVSEKIPSFVIEFVDIFATFRTRRPTDFIKASRSVS